MAVVINDSGVATGGMGVRTPTSVQTPPEISANPLKSLYIHGGGVSYACILELLLLTSKEIWFGPPTFFGLATPLINDEAMQLV